MLAYHATQFEAPANVEVNGVLLQSHLDITDFTITAPILDHYGVSLDDISDDGWYPDQLFLDIERAIYQQPGGNTTLVAIGKETAEQIDVPEGISLTQALMMIPSNYGMSQRNLPEGYGWQVEQVSENHFVFTNNSGSSNHGAFGFVWGLCNRLKANNQVVRVVPRQGFELDATDPAVIDITW